MGIHKASYNQISKSFFTFQAEKQTALCADRTKNIYPSTYTKEKLGTSMRRKIKKDLHIHAQRNEGCSLQPGQFV